MGLLLDTLRSVEFLAGLGDETLTRFMVLGRSLEHPRGHLFWRAGDAASGVVVPVTGTVKCSKHGADGREFIESFRGPGECVGLDAAVDGLPQVADAVVVRAGEFYRIGAEAFRGFVRENPQVYAVAVRQIGRQLRRATQEREDITLRPVVERMAQFLLEHACLRQRDGAKVLVEATQADMAARLGTVREVVARTLADLTERGLVARTEHGIFIEDWDGLHAVAGVTPEEVRHRATMLGSAPGPRSARYFLPIADERGAAAGSDGCAEHLGDLSACRSAGCPGAGPRDPRRR